MQIFPCRFQVRCIEGEDTEDLKSGSIYTVVAVRVCPNGKVFFIIDEDGKFGWFPSRFEAVE